MQRYIRIFFLALSFFAMQSVQAQRGKHGSFTVTAANQILNAYTSLATDATAGSTNITVANNLLNSNFFSGVGVLEAGDLILIIQMQGVSMNGIGNPWGTPLDGTLGAITNYNNCGNYEYAEVAGVSGGGVIQLRCGLVNNYTASGRVQVIRIPRLINLTVNASASITANAWNGTTGGIVALECDGNATINGSVNVNALGFRGGLVDNNSVTFAGQMAATSDLEGAEKGEGVAGWGSEYVFYGGIYGRAAFANAGGGATAHNAGGGGGANAAPIAWNEGLGNPSGYTAAWNLETNVNMVATYNSSMTATTTSGGGGRGGYSHSESNLNPLTNAPNSGSWGADNRRIQGGLGGRPLDYSTGRLFMAGGGGAGDMNDNDGGNGGNGGGMVLITAYGNITGAGSIEANGANGEDTDNSSPALGNYAGKDGAGGAGAGGTVVLSAGGTLGGLSINANGGDGGDNVMTAGAFGSITAVYGPGGGGGGGYVSISSAGPVVSVFGGSNGVTNAPEMSNFPPNGATSGSSGITSVSPASFYDITAANATICSGNTASLSAAITGSSPGGTLTWYSDLNGTVVGTGATYTTPPLTANTTYYVGLCPGSFLVPVSVTVTPGITIDDTFILISDASCGQSNGGISGINATGGTGSLTFDWNGTGYPSTSLSGVPSGSYTLTVSDGNCTATAGPYIIGNTPGVVIDASGVAIVDENCNNGAGSISGITASGGTGTLVYSWNTGQSTLDISSLASGSYSLTVTDQLGCTASTGPFTVNNIGGPSVDISSLVVQNETCTGANGSITGITASGGTGAYTYLWNGTPSTIDQSGLSAGTYTLVVDDGTACQATAGPFIIVDDAGPSIDLSNVIAFDENCGLSNGSITGMAVNGGTPPLTITWNGNPAPLNPSGLSSGFYVLEVTDANGCTDSYSGILILNLDGPVLDESNATVLNENCAGSNGSVSGITVTGGTSPLSYAWNGSPSAGTDLTAAASGTYTLTVTDGAGCTATSAAYTVGFDAPPVINASGITVQNDSCGAAIGSISGITVSGGIPPLTYAWNGSASVSPDTSGLTPGNYTLVVTDANGCQDTEGPLVVGGTVAVNASIVGPTSGCEGDNITLTASGASTIIWNTGTFGPTLSFSLDSTTTVTVAVSDGFCADSLDYTVTMDPLPEITPGPPAAVCVGSAATISATSTAPLQWQTGETTTSIVVSPASTSYFVVSSTNSCGSDIDSVLVTVNALPTIGAGPDQVITAGGNTTLTGTGGSTYVWSPSEGLSCTSCASPQASPGETTTYVVIGTDANGCARADTVIVEVVNNNVVWLPTAFSPNNDTYNDVFQVFGSGIASMNLRVFDRWGNMVFEATDQTQTWDGTYKGTPLTRATFGYVLTGEFVDGTPIDLKGNVTLMR